jgi:hypothetical protein
LERRLVELVVVVVRDLQRDVLAGDGHSAESCDEQRDARKFHATDMFTQQQTDEN